MSNIETLRFRIFILALILYLHLQLNDQVCYPKYVRLKIEKAELHEYIT